MTDPLTARIAALFGNPFYWVRGYSRAFHNGIDLGAPTGTPIPAFRRGTVIFAGNAGSFLNPPHNLPGVPWFAYGGGNVVLVKTDSGVIDIYAHMSQFNVTVGQVVTDGTNLGAVGHTGNATGSHLHFGMFDPSTNGFIDPTPFLITMVNNPPSITFWPGTANVTYPEGHILTSQDVIDIMAKLRAAGYWKDDPTGIAQQGFQSLLTVMVGRTWTDQLAIDIQKGSGQGASQVARDLNPLGVTLPTLPNLGDPVTWLKLGAIILGGVLVVKGLSTLTDIGSPKVGIQMGVQT